MDKILFFCYVTVFISTALQVPWHPATQLWGFTSLHPPRIGWPISLFPQQSGAESLSVPPTLPQAHSPPAAGGTQQLLLAGSRWPRKKRRARRRCPQRGFSAFTEKGTPGKTWIIIQVTFSSLLYLQGAAALVESSLDYCSSPLHQEKGKTLPPCKAKPRKWRGKDWISMLISNYKAQEQLSTCNFWFCFLFLSSCSQSFASEKCYKQPWPSWKKQYAVSLTSTSLFRSLSALWLMVLFINVGRLSAFPE